MPLIEWLLAPILDGNRLYLLLSTFFKVREPAKTALDFSTMFKHEFKKTILGAVIQTMHCQF